MAQKSNELIRVGNDAYRQQDFDKARTQYEEALRTDSFNSSARFNLANTHYRKKNDDEAMKTFDALAHTEKGADMRSQSFYNKGVILSKQKKLEQSIDAYKDALRQNPSDLQARENLQKALMELKKKEPPPEKKEDPKKKKQDQQQKKKQQQQPKMDQKEAEQRLKLLEQKEKEVQQRLQNAKSKSGGSQTKDW